MLPTDLNCDLAELEPPGLTAALCALVHRVNIACGGHAGDEASMQRVLSLAGANGLHVGAHPGLPGNFGRGPVDLDPDGIVRLVESQVGRLSTVLGRTHPSLRLAHVKLHGSLYHHVEHHPEAAQAVARLLARSFPGVAAVGLPWKALAEACEAQGVPFLAEGFLDRAYRADGSLVPRDEPGAVLDSPEAVGDRLRTWLETGCIRSREGSQMELLANTWCLHSDTPGVLELARAARRVMDASGSPRTPTPP